MLTSDFSKGQFKFFSYRSARASQLFDTCQQVVWHVSAYRSSCIGQSFVVRPADLHIIERLLPRLFLLVFAKGTVPAHVCIDGSVKAEHLRDHPRTHLKAIACGNLS